MKWTKEKTEELINFVKGENKTDAINAYAGLMNMQPTAVRVKYNNLVKNQKPTVMNITTPSGARQFKNWSAEETRNLKTYLAEGKSLDEMSELLHRTKSSISSRMWRIEQNKDLAGSTKTTLIPLETYLKEHNLVDKNSLKQQVIPILPPEQPKAVPEQATYSVMKGQTIRIPILSMTVVGNELVIQL